MSQTLWAHQEQAIAEANTYPKRALFWSPRLGKTAAAIGCIKEWGVTRGIVVAPLLVCPMWASLLEEAGHTVTMLFAGTLSKRRATIDRRANTVIVINYDAVPALVEDLLKYEPKFLIVDESHWIKSPSSKRGRAVRRLAWNTDKVRLLTGTPAPNHYGELWGQMTCVDETEWTKSYGKFASRHLVRDTVYPSRVRGYNDLPRIERLLVAGASTVRREEVFGPDQYQFSKRWCSLPNKAQGLYRTLAKSWILQEPRVSAEHVLKRLVRLQQLTSGYLPVDSEGVFLPLVQHQPDEMRDTQNGLCSAEKATEPADVPSGYAPARIQEIHQAKLEAVLGDLDEIVAAGEKAVIYHRFRWEGARYAAAIRQAYPGAWYGEINGSVRVAERTRLAHEFNNSRGPACMVIQAQAGGIGIDLSNVDHALIVSKDFSYDRYKQMIDRIYNRGTELMPLARCITSYLCRGTVDEFIEATLDRKESIHQSIVNEDLRRVVFGTGAIDE